MKLSLKSRKQIMEHVLSQEICRGVPAKEIAKLLVQLIRWNQFEALEDKKGNLIYAWAYYMLTDKALADIKQGIRPRRVNRGNNLVGMFALIPKKGVSIATMRMVLRRAVRMERAKSINIWKRNKTWLSVDTKAWLLDGKGKVRRKRALRIMSVFKGGEQCQQQHCQSG